jgi:phage gp45-like
MSEKFAEIKRKDDGTKDFPVHQVSYHGKIVNALGWYGYGIFANPGDGTFARVSCINDKPDQRIVIPYDPTQRPTAAEGESGIFNPTTGAKVHFKANGDIDVISPGNINIISSGEVAVSGTKLSMQATTDELLALLSDFAEAVRVTQVNDTDGSDGGIWNFTTASRNALAAIRDRIDAITAA